MNRAAVKILALSAVLLVCIIETRAEPFVVIDSLCGKTEVQRAGRQQWQAGAKKMKLYNNDILRVLPQGFVRLTWPDGTISYVRQNTQMLVNLVQSEDAKAKLLSHATVFFGAVFFMVKKIAPRGLFDDSRMKVYTPTAALAIRGTAFLVTVDDKIGTTNVKMVNGTLQVRNILKTEALFLATPCQTTIAMNSDPTPPSVVVKSDIDTIKAWVPAAIVVQAMEKQIAEVKKEASAINNTPLEDRQILVVFSNTSAYSGTWPIAREVANAVCDRLKKSRPKLTFRLADSLGVDPLEAAGKDSVRLLIMGTIEVLDVAQHAAITPRADEYREFTVATVRLRVKLLDVSGGRQISEEVFSGEATGPNRTENTWQGINKLTFNLGDKAFSASLLGKALTQTIDQTTEKMVRYIE